MCHPKKVGTLPIEGRFDPKQTNEIGMFIPLLESIDIQGKDITADVLLTQRKLAVTLGMLNQRLLHSEASFI